MSDDQPPGAPDSRRFLGDVLTFGWVLPAAIAAGAALGYLADRILGIFPVLTASFGALGFVAGLRQIYRESATLARGGKGPRE